MAGKSQKNPLVRWVKKHSMKAKANESRQISLCNLIISGLVAVDENKNLLKSVNNGIIYQNQTTPSDDLKPF